MRPLLLSALFVSMLALGACDSDSTEEPPPPPPEELLPVVFEYRVDAPQPPGITDFGVRYTNEEGEEVIVPTQAPFAFPFVHITDPLALEARGAYSVRVFGALPAGGVTARVRAFRDGLLVATEQVTAQAPAGGGAVDVTATLTIDADGTIDGE